MAHTSAKFASPKEKPKSTPHVLKTLELFVGAGGLALGLHRAGFKPTYVVDSDERVAETLRSNKGRHTRGWGIHVGDVRELRYAELGFDEPELVSAGAPCQPFSVGGRLRGESDDRNMFPEVVRAVRELRPRGFVFENVRGLLFPRVRPYFDYILAQLRAPSLVRISGESWRVHLSRLRAVPEAEHEYRADWRVLNAADFGLAQNRPRLVVVGLGVDEPDFVWPEATHSREALLAALRGDDYWEELEVSSKVRDAIQTTLPARAVAENGHMRWRTLRDLTVSLGPPLADDSVGDQAHVFVPGARLYAKHTGSRLDWPAKTVKAGVHGCPGGEHILLEDDNSHRYLTVRECAALQGFPDDYQLPALRLHAMRQLGNAVPVALGEAIGNGLAEALRD